MSVDTSFWCERVRKCFSMFLKDPQTLQHLLLFGPPGSGKTTLMNCILNTLPEEFHVVTIEQYSELDINRPRTVRFVAPQNKASGLSSATFLYK